jgi:hypothetical protein
LAKTYWVNGSLSSTSPPVHTGTVLPHRGACTHDRRCQESSPTCHHTGACRRTDATARGRGLPNSTSPGRALKRRRGRRTDALLTGRRRPGTLCAMQRDAPGGVADLPRRRRGRRRWCATGRCRRSAAPFTSYAQAATGRRRRVRHVSTRVRHLSRPRSPGSLQAPATTGDQHPPGGHVTRLVADSALSVVPGPGPTGGPVRSLCEARGDQRGRCGGPRPDTRQRLLDRPKFHDTEAMHGDSTRPFCARRGRVLRAGFAQPVSIRPAPKSLASPRPNLHARGPWPRDRHRTAEVLIGQLRFRNAVSSRAYWSSRRPTRTRRARMW